MRRTRAWTRKRASINPSPLESPPPLPPRPTRTPLFPSSLIDPTSRSLPLPSWPQRRPSSLASETCPLRRRITLDPLSEAAAAAAASDGGSWRRRRRRRSPSRCSRPTRRDPTEGRAQLLLDRQRFVAPPPSSLLPRRRPSTGTRPSRLDQDTSLWTRLIDCLPSLDRLRREGA